VRTFFGKGERSSSDVDVRTFWCENYRVFRTLWCARTDKGGKGLSQCGHFADKGVRESIFCDFVRTSFMDGPSRIIASIKCENKCRGFHRVITAADWMSARCDVTKIIDFLQRLSTYL